MCAHWTVGAYPRNTSNGDYGRFLFTPTARNPAPSTPQFGYLSSDGNHMIQHVNYPNCPNRHNTGAGGAGAMPEYTIEYGEEAVRKALGGNLPDFQAQFMQQYGNGSGDGGAAQMNPQVVQMTNNGKSKVAMIPVVLSSEDGDGSNNNSNSGKEAGTVPGVTVPKGNVQDSNCPQTQQEVHSQQGNAGGEGLAQQSTMVDQGSAGGQSNDASASASAMMEQAAKPKPPKPENLLNAFDSVRKIRSNSDVKQGRHVRPSYWAPDIPNPCRKKMGPGAEYPPDVQGQSGQPQATMDINGNPMMMAPPPIDGSGMPMMATPYAGDYDYGAYMNMNPQMAQMMPNQAQAVGFQDPNAMIQTKGPVQRTRSLPLRKPARPTYSLCGKCKKCKNLGSDDTQPPILAFPKYSNGAIPEFDNHQNPHQRGKLTTTSSYLGQSAKNFRAIRFSSHH